MASFIQRSYIPVILLAVPFYLGLGQFDDSFSSNKSVSGSLDTELVEIQRAIELLDAKTPLELQYNAEVQQKIQKFLTTRRGDIRLALERSQLYFPIIESLLDKYDLPLELKYMAIIESGLNPMAKSSSGAVGLWQFLYNTCSLFDLKVDSYIDERRDPYKSTEAACKYLQYLFRTYHDWNLVMASYNGGPGEVRKAIERSGGKTNFWEIRPFLSQQAQNYIPTFIAVNYLMNHYGEYDIKYAQPDLNYDSTDSLMIDYAVSFLQISQILKLPIDQIRFLNPQYKRQYIPDLEGSCLLILPKDKMAEYIKVEKEVLSYMPPEIDYSTLVAKAGCTKNKTHIVHTVKKGEYFHKIAVNYCCTIENILAWNKLESTHIYPGQTLNIWVAN